MAKYQTPFKFQILQNSRTMFKLLTDDSSFPEINEIPRLFHISNHPSKQYASSLERNISRLQFATQILLRNHTNEQIEILKQFINEINKKPINNGPSAAVMKAADHGNFNKRFEFSNYKQKRFKKIISQPSIGKFGRYRFCVCF